MRGSARVERRRSRCWRRRGGRLHLWLLPETLARMYSSSAWLGFPSRSPRGQEFSRLSQSLGRSDFVEPPLHFKRRQLLASQQVLVELSQIASLSPRQTLECFGAKNSQPVIDVTHARSAVGLAVRQNLPGFELDVAGIPFSFVAKDGHQPQQ